MNKEELLKGFSKEQIEIIKACKSEDEILALAKKEGVQLTEQQLAAVNGGFCGKDYGPEKCPACNSDRIVLADNYWVCNSCGKVIRKKKKDDNGYISWAFDALKTGVR